MSFLKRTEYEREILQVINKVFPRYKLHGLTVNALTTWADEAKPNYALYNYLFKLAEKLSDRRAVGSYGFMIAESMVPGVNEVKSNVINLHRTSNP